MIRLLWYRVIGVFKLVFTHDPIQDYVKVLIDELDNRYKIQINQQELTILTLRDELKNKDAMILNLQEKVINILSPREEIVIHQNSEPVLFSRPSFNSERERLEQLNRRKRNEEVLKSVTQRESEVAELLNSTKVD